MKRLYRSLPVIFCFFLFSNVLNAQNGDPGNNSGRIILGWIGLSAVQSSTGDVQESYIIVNPESTYGFDQQFDSQFEKGPGPVFYSLAGDDKLSTNSIPALSSELEVNFIFSPTETGTYKLFASGLELIENQVYLYDHLTKADINLSQNPEYSFNANPGDDTTRFILHFRATGIEPLQESKSFTAYYTNNTLYFNTMSDNDMVSIFDLRGQRVLNTAIKEGQQHAMLVQLPKGVYIARLQSGSTSMNSKFLVR